MEGKKSRHLSIEPVWSYRLKINRLKKEIKYFLKPLYVVGNQAI